MSRNAGEALETGSTRRRESSRDVNHGRVDQASPDASHESQHTWCHRTWRRRPPTTCRILPQGIANVPDHPETRNRHRCKQDGSKAASMTSWQCAVSPCTGGARVLAIRSNTRSSVGKEFHRAHLSARCVLRPIHERCPTGRDCKPATMTCIIACSLSGLILPRSLRTWKVRYSWRGD